MKKTIIILALVALLVMSGIAMADVTGTVCQWDVRDYPLLHAYGKTLSTIAPIQGEGGCIMIAGRCDPMVMSSTVYEPRPIDRTGLQVNEGEAVRIEDVGTVIDARAVSPGSPTIIGGLSVTVHELYLLPVVYDADWSMRIATSRDGYVLAYMPCARVTVSEATSIPTRDVRSNDEACIIDGQCMSRVCTNQDSSRVSGYCESCSETEPFFACARFDTCDSSTKICKRGNGGRCYDNSQCMSNYCKAGFCTASSFKLSWAAPSMEMRRTCTSNAQCRTGELCKDGVCQKLNVVSAPAQQIQRPSGEPAAKAAPTLTIKKNLWSRLTGKVISIFSR